MANLKQFIAAWIVGGWALMGGAQGAWAQSPPDDPTVFLPFLAAAAAQDSGFPSAADPSWERLSPTTPVVTPADQEQIAAAPCGAGTVTVVHTAEHDQYVFCVDETGDVLVIEALADGEAARSRLNQFPDPLGLLMAVVPAAEPVPASVRRSLETGTRLPGWTPYVIGRAAEGAPLSVSPSEVSAAASCATPSLGFTPSQTFFNDYTYCGMVSVASTSSNDTDWHAHGASYLTAAGEGSHSHEGPHLPPYEYYYADEDEEGDARYGRARVRSCGGTTLLRGWVKASPTTGSWSPIATFTVQNGYLVTMHWYSNSQHSLWMGYDADDIFFRTDAQNGASFGSRFSFLKYAYGPYCDLKY